MSDTDIIVELYHKLEATRGRNVFGVLGQTYQSLARFAGELRRGKMPDGRPFPAPLSVTHGILATIPDHEFHDLVQNEARYPLPTRQQVELAFRRFVRDSFAKTSGLVILEQLELLYAYTLDLGLLRELATDTHSLLLLLPGKREGDSLRLFPTDQSGRAYILPRQLLVESHLWELQD